MKTLSIISVSTKTVSLLILSEGANFELETPIAWQLLDESKSVIRSDVAKTTSVFIEDLQPAGDYTFCSDAGSLGFKTEPCTGTVNAAEFGVTAASMDNAEAFKKAISATPVGGTLLVPTGRFLSGPIFLKSSMTLYLPSGCEIAAIEDREQWPILPAHDDQGQVCGTWEGLPEASFAALINALHCRHLTISGRGILDGGGDRGDWWQWPKETRQGARRPRTVFLSHSDNISLSGMFVRNSPSWTIHPFHCKQLTASALTIYNPSDSPNTDGFNPESCTDIVMAGLDFSVGDDCIAIKAGKRAGKISRHLAPCTRINIHHCRMARGHGAVVLGSEMSGDITDVAISHCEFLGTDRGLRLKTRRGRGGRIMNISMSDVVMHDVATPFSCNAFYFCDADGRSDEVQSRQAAAVDHTTPHIDGIRLSNIKASDISLTAVALLGLPEAHIKNVELSNFHVSYKPDAIADVPLMALHVAPVRHAGIVSTFAHLVGGLQLIDTTQDPI